MKITIRSGVNLHLTHEIEFDNEQISDCICMGLRHGLFGSENKESLPDNSSALESIACAIDNLAQAIRTK